MTTEPQSPPAPPPAETPPKGFRLSLDWWAVITALAATLLIAIGIIPNVPW